MENFSAGVLARWGLDYETVREWNPEIVYVTMSGPGHDGPVVERDHVRADDPRAVRPDLPVEPARAQRRRTRASPSTTTPPASASVVAVLAALEERRRTGEGQHIDIAQMETGTYLIGPAVLDHFANGRDAHPDRQRRPVRPVLPERGLPLRRPGGAGDHLPRRRRLAPALRRRSRADIERSRRRRRRCGPSTAGSPASPRSTSASVRGARPARRKPAPKQLQAERRTGRTRAGRR